MPSAVTRGLVPRVPLRKAQRAPKRDDRDIGERSDAVLRTAMPGRDDLNASGNFRCDERMRLSDAAAAKY
jgi:hypothetical protein